MSKEDILARLETFIGARDLSAIRRLGTGIHGTVFVVENNHNRRRSAVKVHFEEAPYRRECEVYERLRDLDIFEIEGFAVPYFLGSDDALLAFEMTIVAPPFALDFGAAWVDEPPDFSEEVWADLDEKLRDDFGEKWPIADRVILAFRLHGIYWLDVNTDNLCFE